MVWERKYLIGGIEGWEHLKTKDLIFVRHKTQWEVVLNNKPIHAVTSEMEANGLMDEYIEAYQEK